MAAILFLVLFIVMMAKCWRFFLENSDDIKRIRALEPWYWFVFLNLILTLISSNYDYRYISIGFLIQVALSVWFAISMGWIVQSCHHKSAISHPSWFVKGKNVKFCFRCGTRLSDGFHTSMVKDHSWQGIFLQIPPHLFQYVFLWIIQSVMVLISLFLALRFLKQSDLQHQAVLVAVILVILAPPVIYSLGRFRGYLADTKGLIWWDDFKGSIITWIIVIVIVCGLLYFL